MKNIILITILLGPISTLAATLKSISCDLHINYLDIGKTLTYAMENPDVSLNVLKDKTVLTTSETQCEDWTEITFGKSEYERLLKGEEVIADFNYESVGDTIKALVACRAELEK